MKKLTLHILIVLLLLNLSIDFVSAQKELEVQYPTISGVTTPSPGISIPNYVKYIFHFIIWASGIIALGVLIYAGFIYLTSAGDPMKLQDSKERIRAALLGLVILLASYIILITINPQLVIVNVKPPTPVGPTLPPGVIGCSERVGINTAWNLTNEINNPDTPQERKEQIREQLAEIWKNMAEKCYRIDKGGNVPPQYEDKTQYIYFIPDFLPEDRKKYGVIIYKDRGFMGEAKVLTSLSDSPAEESSGGIDISSARPFILEDMPSAGSKAILYEKINFNFGKTAQNAGVLDITSFTCYMPQFTPESVEIKGDIIIVLTTGAQLQGETEVFLDPGDFDLNSSRVAEWQWPWNCPNFLPCKKSAVESACSYPAKFIQ